MATKSGYLGNPNLKQEHEIIEATQEQQQEYALCMLDPIYFITNYVKIVSLDHGIVPFKMYDYQKRFVETMHNENRVLGMMSRQQGKCNFKDTKYMIRNKKTGEIRSVTAEEFHQSQLNERSKNM